KYSDVLYIESLIAADTVNTVPPATYDAFRDHGKVALTIEQDVDEARRVLDTFKAKGFALPDSTQQLTEEGVKSFDASFDSLLSTIEARRDLAMRGMADRHTLHLASEQLLVDQNAQLADKEKYVDRIWKKDATLWKND